MNSAYSRRLARLVVGLTAVVATVAVAAAPAAGEVGYPTPLRHHSTVFDSLRSDVEDLCVAGAEDCDERLPDPCVDSGVCDPPVPDDPCTLDASLCDGVAPLRDPCAEAQGACSDSELAPWSGCVGDADVGACRPFGTELSDTEWQQVAEDALSARNDYLVTGHAPVPGNGASARFAFYDSWLSTDRAALDARRAALAVTDVGYTSAGTTFALDSVTVDPGRAVVRGVEDFVLGMTGVNGNDGVPATTSGRSVTELTFLYTAAGWELTTVYDDHPGSPLYPEFEDADPLSPPPLGEPMYPMDPTYDLAGAVPDPDGVQARIAVPSENGGPFMPVDRQAVVNYAIRYSGTNGHPYNGAYRAFTNDCTNFISQALRAGGWTDVGGSNPWFYHHGSAYSRSWTVAQDFYNFAYSTRRAALLTDYRRALPGDVLQAKMPTYNPGKLGHSMVVTAKDRRGNVYLTYHTSNRENYPLSQFLVAASSRSGQQPTMYGWSTG